MKSLRWTGIVTLALACILTAPASAVPPATIIADTSVVIDSTLLAFWHFDEAAGDNIADETGKHDGVATGTTIVQGVLGNARYFHGLPDGGRVENDPALNLDSTSFVIEMWFRTLAANGFVLRRGVAPVPGFSISLGGGKLIANIGNREDSSWPDTLLYVVSDSPVNDGVWHKMRFVRDRSVKKVYLYVDNLLATAPLDDPLTFPLDSDRPLTFAYWESTGLYSYAGLLDEVKIMKFTTTYLAPKLNISSSALRFGPTAVGGRDSLDLRLTNLGSRDSLKISSISSTSPEFSTSFGQSLILGKGDTVTLRIRYSPTAPGKDTAMVRIISNDLDAPITDIRLTGVSYVLNHVPYVSEIAVVPNTYYSVRVSWFRTVDDTANAPDPLTQYQVFVSTNKTSWTVVNSMLAIGVPQYYAFAGIPYSEWSKPHWFVVAAQTKGGTTYSSAADSLGPVYVTGMDESPQNVIPGRFGLEQNHPNPFNPSTEIQYRIGNRELATVKVFDLLGREVAVLVDEVKEPGTYSITWNAGGLPSGVYFARLEAGGRVATVRMMLVR